MRDIIPNPPAEVNSLTIYDETHGFTRREIKGMVYITETDWHRTNAIMDYEQRSRRAAEARAEGAAEYYGGAN